MYCTTPRCSMRQGLAKAGVGISGDAQKLARDFNGLACAGAVCLSDMANKRLSDAGRLPERWSLASEQSAQELCF